MGLLQPKAKKELGTNRKGSAKLLILWYNIIGQKTLSHERIVPQK